MRYSCLYIDPPFDRLAGAIALLMEGVARQCAVLGPHTFAIWGTSYGLPGAIAFLKRRMAPALDSLRESKESGKFLHEAGTAAAPRQ